MWCGYVKKVGEERVPKRAPDGVYLAERREADLRKCGSMDY